MATILFVTWDGGGNVPPALGIAAELRRRGHATRFLGHRSQEAAIVAGGHRFRPYATARDHVGARPPSTARTVTLFSDRAMGRDAVAEAERSGADLLVVDALLMGAVDVVARAGLPYVPLGHWFVGYQRDGWLRTPMAGLARLRRQRPRARWDGAPVQLAATLPELDPGTASAVPNLRVTGPVLAPPEQRASFVEPAILVSLSTVHFRGMAGTLQRVVDAVGGLGARVVVTTGPAVDPASLRVPPSVELHRYVPHDEVMPEVSLVVGHGGHATTMRALAHDLPLLVVPMEAMLDQPVVGRAVERAGAGRLLSRKAPVDRLRAAAVELLEDGPHRAAAARLGERIRSYDGAGAAADEIEAVLSRPLARAPRRGRPAARP